MLLTVQQGSWNPAEEGILLRPFSSQIPVHFAGLHGLLV